MGKGSKRRVENFKKLQENWDDIVWETKGTKIARKNRAKCNKLTKKERMNLLEKSLDMVYAENPELDPRTNQS